MEYLFGLGILIAAWTGGYWIFRPNNRRIYFWCGFLGLFVPYCMQLIYPSYRFMRVLGDLGLL